MTDNFDRLSSRRVATLEEYEACATDLGVVRDRLGQVSVLALPGSERRPALVRLHLAIMPEDASRPAIALTAKTSPYSDAYTHVRVARDNPEEIYVSGDPSLTAEEILAMANDGIQLLETYSALSDDDKGRADWGHVGPRVSDFMSSPQEIHDALSRVGIEPDGLPLTFDVQAAWRDAFPPQN